MALCQGADIFNSKKCLKSSFPCNFLVDVYIKPALAIDYDPDLKVGKLPKEQWVVWLCVCYALPCLRSVGHPRVVSSFVARLLWQPKRFFPPRHPHLSMS